MCMHFAMFDLHYGTFITFNGSTGGTLIDFLVRVGVFISFMEPLSVNFLKCTFQKDLADIITFYLLKAQSVENPIRIKRTFK